MANNFGKNALNSSFATSIARSANKAFEYGDILFAIGIIGIIMVLLFPIPKLFLDLLLALSVTCSLVILITCLFLNKPLDLSSFPTILLVVTTLRLALNIASTRLILSEGHGGAQAAGKMIESFGKFVMSGNVVIGIIVYSILTIINFIVITKGSGRIAEVAARFSLDAMPGKQMAIDADLSAGIIEEKEAKARRQELEDESSFYGAMDGANKFVRGDAIAGLLITFINFIAGILIGVVQRKLDFQQALQTYTLLTIGDGLVSQIPSLIVSLAAGLLVSKSGVVGSAEKAIFGQLSKFPQAILVSCVLLFAMVFLPGLPAFPFLILSLMLLIVLIAISNRKQPEEQIKTVKTSHNMEDRDGAQEGAATAPEEQTLSSSLHIENIKISLGFNLVSLVNSNGQKLTDRIKNLRRQMAKDLGFILPSVRIQDNMNINKNEYKIYIKEIETSGGIIYTDKIMAMDPSGKDIDFSGEKTTEPAFGLPATWISNDYKEEAILRGYTVVEPITVIITHLTEIVKENITELLNYENTQQILEDLPAQHKKLLSEICPSQITVSNIQKILQNLLNEMVSIRDISTILESIADICRTSKNILAITEYVRSKLSRQISYNYLDHKGYLNIAILSSEWEQVLTDNFVAINNEDKQLNLSPQQLQQFMQDVNQAYEDFAKQALIPCLLVSPAYRPYIRQIIERFKSNLVVLSQNEIHPKIKVKTIGQVG
jgi:flagellar biosynthesis protein FlhA